MQKWKTPLLLADVNKADRMNAQTLTSTPSDMESGYSRWQDKLHSATTGSKAHRDAWRVLPILANARRRPIQVSRKVKTSMQLPPPLHKKNCVR